VKRAMNIVVCIKQVPAIAEVQIDTGTGTLVRQGAAAEVNPFDLHAIEEGIRTKEKYGGKVTAISMGPPQAETALREALALGCDGAVLLSDRSFAGADTLATSYTLSEGIKKIGDFDLVICGLKTTDGGTAQVGPALAEQLDLPHLSYVSRIQSIENGRIIAERMTEEDYETNEAPLPCVLSIVREINRPRMISLRGRVMANKIPILKWDAQELKVDGKRVGLDGSPTRVIKTVSLKLAKKAELIVGNPDTQVEKLIEKFEEWKIFGRSA